MTSESTSADGRPAEKRERDETYHSRALLRLIARQVVLSLQRQQSARDSTTTLATPSSSQRASRSDNET